MADETPDRDFCPHRVPYRKWSFDRSPYARSDEKHLVILNADACPDCLRGRIRTLHGAINGLLGAVARSRDAEVMHAAEAAVEAYYADIKEWF